MTDIADEEASSEPNAPTAAAAATRATYLASSPVSVSSPAPLRALLAVVESKHDQGGRRPIEGAARAVTVGNDVGRQTLLGALPSRSPSLATAHFLPTERVDKFARYTSWLYCILYSLYLHFHRAGRDGDLHLLAGHSQHP